MGWFSLANLLLECVDHLVVSSDDRLLRLLDNSSSDDNLLGVSFSDHSCLSVDNSHVSVESTVVSDESLNLWSSLTLWDSLVSFELSANFIDVLLSILDDQGSVELSVDSLSLSFWSSLLLVSQSEDLLFEVLDDSLSWDSLG